jgi:hypothetical protein
MSYAECRYVECEMLAVEVSKEECFKFLTCFFNNKKGDFYSGN